MNGKTTTGQMMAMMSKQVRKQVSPHTAVWVDQEDKTMNDTKQSSIEWLVEQLKPAITLQEKYINEFLQKAKAMHRKEIEDSWLDGVGNWDSEKEAEQYYNKIFGGQIKPEIDLDKVIKVEPKLRKVYE